MVIRELNHVGLRTTDLEAGLKLYRDALGGRVILDAYALDGKGHILYVQMGNTVVELILTGDKAAEGFAHLAFLLEGRDLDAWYERLTAEGYAFSIPPRTAGTGNGRLAFFDNGTGLTLELIERTEDIRLEPFAARAFTALDHIAVCVPEAGRADTARIFTEEFGFAREGERRFRKGADRVEIVAPYPGSRAVDHLAFRTADMEKTLAALRAAGLRPVKDPAGTVTATGVAGERLVFARA